MPKKLWEILITVINGKPHKFSIDLQEFNASSNDLFNDIPRAYYFRETSQSNRKEKLDFYVKVTSELIDQYFPNNEHGIHNAAIEFGLDSIRRAPNEREIIFTTDEYKRIKSQPLREGAKLRVEVLEFINTVNEFWPNESISPINLQDNLIGTDKSAIEWLTVLVREELLETAGFKEHCKARGKGNTLAYRTAALARDRIKKEVNNGDFPDNKFYKLIELEVEQEGAFIFVIMPFREEEFPQNIYDQIIKPSVESIIDCKCRRNDEDSWLGQLDDKFYSHIRKSQFLIAELTTQNPNVVYELGMAHSFNKEVIMLVDNHLKEKDLSFDYDKFNTIFYSSKDELETKLNNSIQSLGKKLNIPFRKSN